MSALHWTGIGLLLLIIELFSLTGFLLCIALSAGFVAVILFFFPFLPISYQCLLFSITALASCLLWRYYLQYRSPQEDKLKLNRRNEQYIDRVFILETPIIKGRGKIHVDDSIWRIEGEDLPTGTKVRVVSVDGVVLHVTAIQ